MPGRRAPHQGEGRLHRAAARLRHPQGEERQQGRARPLRRRQGRAQAQARRVPRRATRAHPGRRRDHRRPFRGRPVRRRHRHLDRQGLRRRHEALELRAACAPRTACRSRTARSARPAAVRIPARPSRTRRCPATWASSASPRSISRRADRRRARPDPGRGRGARRQGRLDHGARRGQEGAAEGGAEARQVPALPRPPGRRRAAPADRRGPPAAAPQGGA